MAKRLLSAHFTIALFQTERYISILSSYLFCKCNDNYNLKHSKCASQKDLQLNAEMLMEVG